MALQSKHARASARSRGLCDSVLTSLSPDFAARRDSSASVCGVHVQDRKAAVYWLYHLKEHVRIYLDCDDSSEIRKLIELSLPEGVALKSRPLPRKGIALRTPLFFDIETEVQAELLGAVLQLVAELRRKSKSSRSAKADQPWTAQSETLSTTPDGIYEGARISVLVNKYERDPRNRQRCIETYGSVCSVCNFDFSKAYEIIGQGYIHVHHLTPLASQKGKAHRVDPVKDLRPVCPNCHEILHRSEPPFTIEELKAIMRN